MTWSNLPAGHLRSESFLCPLSIFCGPYTMSTKTGLAILRASPSSDHSCFSILISRTFPALNIAALSPLRTRLSDARSRLWPPQMLPTCLSVTAYAAQLFHVAEEGSSSTLIDIAHSRGSQRGTRNILESYSSGAACPFNRFTTTQHYKSFICRLSGLCQTAG